MMVDDIPNRPLYFYQKDIIAQMAPVEERMEQFSMENSFFYWVNQLQMAMFNLNG